jgi:ubiquinone/menaquinone biosynthesis C-methylase UbiE
MTYTEKDLIITLDRLVPKGANDGATAEALQYLDQYHVGGSQSVERLLVTLNPSPSDIVLDIGSGLGGPARQVATASGCRVTGVDITEAYVDAAAELTDRCGLSDRVRFVHSDIANLLPEHPFDAGYTMHVQMNIEAKGQWFAEIAQRLAPRARFAVWEVRLGQLLVRRHVRRGPFFGPHAANAPGGRFRSGAQLRRSAR